VSRRNWAFDLALAGLVGVLGQLEAWWGIGETHRQGPLWAPALLYAVTALLLIGRRVRPLAALTVMVALYLVEFAAFGAPQGYGVALAPGIALYSVGRYVEPPRAFLALGLAVVLWAGWASLDPLSDGAPLGERIGTAVWLTPWVMAWLMGSLVRMTGLYREQRRLARVQGQVRAVVEERNRIARELHDVIGHSVSVMTVQASAVRRRLPPDLVVEREAIETVEAVGREALAEMRRMVAVLREDVVAETSGLEPPPGLSQLDRLVEKFRAAGLPVSVSVSGASRQLAPGLDLTAYRVVQEGLTNALRHANGPRRADVTIAFLPDHLELAVRDDGAAPPAGAERSQHEPGSGLLGMRERVAVYGGSLVARAGPAGGFEVVATLPLEPV
jgi:signal transduction histidine kinase